jgi:hypothetical protein
MRYLARTLASVFVLAAVLVAAGCGDDTASGPTQPADGLVGDTLRKTGTGQGATGAFLVDGQFNVRVDSTTVTPENARLRVYQLTPLGEGYRTRLVGLAGNVGPKALSGEIEMLPGGQFDARVNLGPGEFYLVLETAAGNSWTMIVTGVAGVPSG